MDDFRGMLEGRDDEVIEALQKIVTASPDYVYTPPGDTGWCLYSYNGDPSCLVGQALAEVGVPIDALESFNPGGKYGEDVGLIASNAAIILGLAKSTGVYLQVAQKVQDNGKPWGEALAAAEAAIQQV